MSTKSLTLFQRSVRLAQTSFRRWHNWMLDRLPGLENPPEIEERMRRNAFVDLWHFTPHEFVMAWRSAWRQYKDSFKGISDEEYEANKLQVRQIMMGVKSRISSNVESNKQSLEEELQGTQLLQNVKELSRTTTENVEFLKHEMDNVKSNVNTAAIKKNLEQNLEDNLSKEDVVTTLQNNIHELADMAKAGRKVALDMKKQDVDHVKATLQQWFADKLVVGQLVILSFINGYREGKELEMTREDALLVTFAKKTASEQKDKLKGYLDKFVEEQRTKQRAEDAQEAAQAQEGQATTKADTSRAQAGSESPSDSTCQQEDESSLADDPKRPQQSEKTQSTG